MIFAAMLDPASAASAVAELTPQTQLVLTIGALVVTGLAAYLFGRERGLALFEKRFAAFRSQLDLDRTVWKYRSDQEETNGKSVGTLRFRQSGSRLFGQSDNGRLVFEGSTVGPRICLVFAKGAGRSPQVGSITAEVDAATDSLVGLQATCKDDDGFVIEQIRLTRVTAQV